MNFKHLWHVYMYRKGAVGGTFEHGGHQIEVVFVESPNADPAIEMTYRGYSSERVHFSRALQTTANLENAIQLFIKEVNAELGAEA